MKKTCSRCNETKNRFEDFYWAWDKRTEARHPRAICKTCDGKASTDQFRGDYKEKQRLLAKARSRAMQELRRRKPDLHKTMTQEELKKLPSYPNCTRVEKQRARDRAHNSLARMFPLEFLHLHNEFRVEEGLPKIKRSQSRLIKKHGSEKGYW